MARTLTTPDINPATTQQAITAFRIDVPHSRNAGDTSMEIEKPSVHAWYEVTTYDVSGNIIKRDTTIVPFQLFTEGIGWEAHWPPNFLLDIKSAYARLQTHAESIGFIAGPGVDEPLE